MPVPLKLLKKLTSKSKATGKDIEQLSAKIKEAVWKKHEEKK